MDRDFAERLCDRAMPGSVRATVGDWVLRHDLGATGRANSLWPTGDPGCSIPEAIDRAEAWYRARDATPAVIVFDRGTAAEDLNAELNRRAYSVAEGAEVLVADTNLITGNALAAAPGRTVVVTKVPSAVTRVLMADDERLAEVTRTDLDQRFVSVTDTDGAPLGGGMTTIDGDWFGIFAMKTMPGARRRGIAHQVIANLALAAIEAGALQAWLQVMASNTTAVALYQKLGFRPVHGYHYRMGQA